MRFYIAFTRRTRTSIAIPVAVANFPPSRLAAEQPQALPAPTSARASRLADGIVSKQLYFAPARAKTTICKAVDAALGAA